MRVRYNEAVFTKSTREIPLGRTSKQLHSDLERRNQGSDSCAQRPVRVCYQHFKWVRKKEGNGIRGKKIRHETSIFNYVVNSPRVVGAQFVRGIRWLDFSENPRCEREEGLMSINIRVEGENEAMRLKFLFVFASTTKDLPTPACGFA